MTSTAQQVWKAIDEDVVARRALEKNIISLKNLALYLIKEKRIEASSDAVISAIRRYKEEQPVGTLLDLARKTISDSRDVRITSNITEVVLERTRETQLILEKAFSVVSIEKGELLLIIQGEQNIKLMINGKNTEAILKIFGTHVQATREKLGQINITLSDEAVKTPGILSVFTTELMMYGINLVEMASCVPEMLFFIPEKDVLKAYQVLYGLCSKS